LKDENRSLNKENKLLKDENSSLHGCTFNSWNI
jgi:hypothetical protein